MSKHYSEYRSTYKWHEFTPNTSASLPAASTASTASASNNEVVVKKPPKPISDDFHFARKKKHPELAHRSHEFFDPSLAPPFPTREDQNRERSKQRRKPTFREAQRRAQSEGPGIRNPLFRAAPDETDIRPALSTFSRSTSARRGRGSSAQNKAHSTSNDTQDGSMQSSYPPPAPSSKWASRQSHSARPSTQMKESVSMGQIDAAKDGGSRSGSGHHRDEDVVTTKSMSASQDISSDVRTRRRDYKSEYKQRFRPFSQYEYLGESGRYIPSPNGQITPPTTTATATKSSSSSTNSAKQQQQQKEQQQKEQQQQRQQQLQQQQQQQQQQLVLQQKATSLQGEPWYREVVELRKQANDYKCRGWGTDLLPPHMSDIYHKQIELHEAAARRESLSALSLAISSPRPDSSSTRGTSSSGAGDHRISPSKSASLGRPSRPRTAPPNRASSKSSRSESAHPVSDTGAIKRQDTVDGSTTARKQSQLSNNSALGGRAKSPTKRVASRPPSASTASSSVAPSPAPVQGEAVNKQSAASQNQQPPKRQRPNENNTTTASAASVKSGSDYQRRPFSRSSSKGGVGAASTTSSRPPSAFENHIDYFREPVVKSPPEPTRVKSPEAVVRSPDPINWTVPLDTGKTFSVTQSIKDGESSRHSPMSDHSSSLFDSVSGTAINLGGRSGSGIGSLGGGNGSTCGSSYKDGSHQRISSLARDVRDLQPGLIKDSTLMRPCVVSNQTADNSRPLATEAHPNPSIPELAEENVRDDVEKVDNIADMMTSTYPQAASKNGGHMEGHMNGGQNSNTTTNGSGSLLTSDCTGAVVAGIDSTADTSLKCLEEPSFEFEASNEAKKNSEAAPALASAAAVKKPSYRVLEDPYAEAPLEATAAASKGPKAPNYRVLEDPMTTAMYDPSTSSEAVSASAVTGMPGSSRPPASEVLEGAREKFDKFWGSKPRNNTTSDNNEP